MDKYDNKIWWREEDFKGMKDADKRAAIVASAISFADDCMANMDSFYSNSAEFELMYQKRSYSNFGRTNESTTTDSPLQVRERAPAYNVVRMNVNTATNRVAKIKP